VIAKILMRPVAWIIAGALLFAAFGLAVHYWGAARQARGEARQAHAEGKAVSGSIKDASGAVARSVEASGVIDEEVKETQDAIANSSSVNDITGLGSAGVRQQRDRARKPKPLH
jgi:hypothetical protein